MDFVSIWFISDGIRERRYNPLSEEHPFQKSSNESVRGNIGDNVIHIMEH